MKILLAADGSRFTKKALAFVLTYAAPADEEAELLVLNVQPALPQHVTRHLDKTVVNDYYREQADKVLKPIGRFLDRHTLSYRTDWTLGAIDAEIVKAARKNKSSLIVMGTHGHGLLGRVVLGSVAQRVLADSPVPVLLVK